MKEPFKPFIFNTFDHDNKLVSVVFLFTNIFYQQFTCKRLCLFINICISINNADETS